MSEKVVRLIADTLNQINSSYGKGDIKTMFFDLPLREGRIRGFVICKCTSFTEIRRFTLTEDTLAFRGQKRKVRLNDVH